MVMSLGRTGKVMLVSMGVFWGLIFFGLNVSLTHFNRLVEPQHPVHLVNWQIQNHKLEICLLGEKFLLSLDSEIPAGLRDNALNIIDLTRDGVEEKLTDISNKLQEWGCPGVMQFLSDHNDKL